MVKHCCEDMTYWANFACEFHEDPFQCPDHLIHYSAKFDEYGVIIHDGGSSLIVISYCPWCGKKFPLSKRDLWFDTLEGLGYNNPFEQEIPEKFQTDKWWNK
ncbi:hypothetical protein AM500_17860 [Bacillus sp. FJAT-18017]|uniref:DUF6980 family protein n=1 Tax=Bacillus sp. FJAT-18017 TaxID=1705566 RepID=UPI0006AFE2DB|nr:hypothetical protein [Bacillus sp. FJAT-18017]ALC91447.1 hypothetical protein AM500_17860 [Bacillus sp. FJAT-18017]